MFRFYIVKNNIIGTYLFLKNRNFESWLKTIKKIFRISIFGALNFDTFWRCLYFTLKPYVLEAPESWPLFNAKSRDVTKTPFCLLLLDEFC